MSPAEQAELETLKRLGDELEHEPFPEGWDRHVAAEMGDAGVITLGLLFIAWKLFLAGVPPQVIHDNLTAPLVDEEARGCCSRTLKALMKMPTPTFH
jgi:hypothetical protein